MQKINSALLIILLLAVGYLLVDKFSSTSKDEPVEEISSMTEDVSADTTTTLPGEGQIAFVDLDTLNAKFEYLSDKLDIMQGEQMRQQKNFEREAKRVETRYITLQEEAYKMTQDQLQAAQTEMENAQAGLQSSQERITKELLALETSIQTELDERIDAELEKVNAKYGFDYILARAAGSGVLLAKDQFDITQEVLEGLNRAYTAEKTAETP